MKRSKTAEVIDRLLAKHKRFNEEKRVGSVGYDEKTGSIVFYFDDRANQYRYWLPFSEVREPEGQLRWIYHLRGKGWFSSQVMNDFLDVMEYLGARPKT